MSNFGPLCRDGIFGNYQQKGSRVINSRSEAKFKHFKANDVLVRQEYVVNGNVTIVAEHGNISPYTVKHGFAIASGNDNDQPLLLIGGNNEPMTLEAGERIIGLSAKGFNLEPLGDEVEMNVELYERANVADADTICDSLLGDDFTSHENGDPYLDDWMNGIWGYPDGASFLVRDTANSITGYLGISVGDDWTAGRVEVKMTTIKIPLSN